MRRTRDEATTEAYRLVSRYVEPPISMRPRPQQGEEDPQTVRERRAYRLEQATALLASSPFGDHLVNACVSGDNLYACNLARAIAAEGA